MKDIVNEATGRLVFTWACSGMNTLTIIHDAYTVCVFTILSDIIY